MEKNLFTIFAVALLVSCSSHDEDMTDTGRIALSASVAKNELKTTGPINAGFTTDFSIGVYAYNGEWKAGSSANIINNNNATVKGAAGHEIVFGAGSPYYYPTDNSQVNFYAFSPQGTEVTEAGLGVSPVVNLAITGQEDVMWSSSTGSMQSVKPVLAFSHKLTQIQFTFKADATYVTDNKVVSLTVKGQPTTVAMTVGDGGCVFSGSQNMQALATANQTAGIAISTLGTDALSPVMTRAAGAYTFDFVVKQGNGSANVTYTDVPLVLTLNAGSAHMVTFTFSAKGITASATVANWLTGTSGSVTVL